MGPWYSTVHLHSVTGSTWFLFPLYPGAAKWKYQKSLCHSNPTNQEQSFNARSNSNLIVNIRRTWWNSRGTAAAISCLLSISCHTALIYIHVQYIHYIYRAGVGIRPLILHVDLRQRPGGGGHLPQIPWEKAPPPPPPPKHNIYFCNDTQKTKFIDLHCIQLFIVRLRKLLYFLGDHPHGALPAWKNRCITRKNSCCRHLVCVRREWVALRSSVPQKKVS